MKMEILYAQMKDVLTFMGLSFGGMHLVDVKIGNGCITFSYGNVTLTIRDEV